MNKRKLLVVLMAVLTSTGCDMIKTIMTGKTEIIQEGKKVSLDRNANGTYDFFTFYDKEGNQVRAESDENEDGNIDGWQTFKNGVLVKQSADKNDDGKPDYWGYYENEKLVYGEIDRDFNGIVERWVIFENGVIRQVIQDSDGDGKKDVWSYLKNDVPYKKAIDTNGDEIPDQEVPID